MAHLVSHPHPELTRTRSPLHGCWPRYASALLGAWLIISAFAWSHAPALRTDTWLVGALIVTFALSAVISGPLRLVNAALAIWLLFSTFMFRQLAMGTLWNNAIVAVLVFVLAMIPNGAALER